MDESRIQSTLLGWIISLAIAVSVMLRRDKDQRQKWFVIFAGNVTLYYFFTFLFYWRGEPWYERISLSMAVFVPLSGLYFFRAFAARPVRRVRINRLAMAIAVVLNVVVLHPTWLKPAVGAAVLAYVVGFMLVAMFDLNVQARKASTRVDAARIRYLFAGGLLTLALQIVERLGHLFPVDLAPVGLAMTLIYLYIISQAIVRYRVLDLYETMGRFAVLTLMGAALAGIYTALVFWAGKGSAINAFLASLVILLLFDPLRDLVERKIADFFFGERRILEQLILELRRRLAHIISIDTMVEVLVEGLEDSRRFTHGALYLIDPHWRGFDLRAHMGPEPGSKRVEAAAARRHLRPYASRVGAVVKAELSSRREELLREGKAEATEGLTETLELMESMNADVVLMLEGEDRTLGFLSLRDERIREAFSVEEVSMLAGLAGQIAITVENSQLYQRMKERDRLAALGEMSAGLAHEIRNPLGAIKAAAQFIEEVAEDGDGETASDREFLSVIVEEVDRLNRVVTDFLVYARPFKGIPTEVDANEILRRTLQVFETGRTDSTDLLVDYGAELPRVTIDGERLHQVFLNLIINSVQAMDGREEARLEITSRVRRVRTIGRDNPSAEPSRFVEVLFSDNGPGIPPEILQNIFIPFFTTKSRGSGLGLSVCQRIVRDAGGEIELRSQTGQGTIFTVVLPASAEDRKSSSEMEPALKESGD